MNKKILIISNFILVLCFGMMSLITLFKTVKLENDVKREINRFEESLSEFDRDIVSYVQDSSKFWSERKAYVFFEKGVDEDKIIELRDQIYKRFSKVKLIEYTSDRDAYDEYKTFLESSGKNETLLEVLKAKEEKVLEASLEISLEDSEEKKDLIDWLNGVKSEYGISIIK